jgi:hypothetical protein
MVLWDTLELDTPQQQLCSWHHLYVAVNHMTGFQDTKWHLGSDAGVAGADMESYISYIGGTLSVPP